MKKIIFFFVFSPVFMLSAQEIPLTETEEQVSDEISEDRQVLSVSKKQTESLAEAANSAGADAAVKDDAKEVALSAVTSEIAAVDDALVWDSEENDSEQPLADSASATVAIPILHRAEHAARKEWEAIAGVVSPTETESKLILAVLTDIHVKEIRITENNELGKIEKKMQVNFLRYEKNNRLKAVLNKQQFKLYREWEKSKSE